MTVFSQEEQQRYLDSMDRAYDVLDRARAALPIKDTENVDEAADVGEPSSAMLSLLEQAEWEAGGPVDIPADLKADIIAEYPELVDVIGIKSLLAPETTA